MRRKQRFAVFLISVIYLASAQMTMSDGADYPGFGNAIQTEGSQLAPYRIIRHNNYGSHINNELRRRPPMKPNIPRMRKSSRETVIQNKATCDGKANLISDIGLFAIITGAVDALMSLYSTGFTSFVSNTVSTVNAMFSFGFGIPSAILTYLAASDQVSYTVANVLSMLSFANTFYGLWSVDKGNIGILISTAANVLGVVSLALSVAAAYPSLIDDTIDLIGDTTGNRKKVNRFVNSYGCSKSDPSLQVLINRLFEEIV